MIMLLGFYYLTNRLLIGEPPELEGISFETGSTLLAKEGGLLMNPQTAPLVFAFFFGMVAASVLIPLNRRIQSTPIIMA